MQIFKIVALVIAVSAVTILGIFGFAIWVFIPMLPAGLIVAIAVLSSRRRQAQRDAQERDTDWRKAA